RQPPLGLAPYRSREARAGADEVEPALGIVEPEQQRRDPAVCLVAPAEADDHAVGRPVRLHLDDAFARAGEVRQTAPLGDDTVEAGRLEALQPVAGLRQIAGDR